jgi:hypothetical protein
MVLFVKADCEDGFVSELVKMVRCSGFVMAEEMAVQVFDVSCSGRVCGAETVRW